MNIVARLVIPFVLAAVAQVLLGLRVGADLHTFFGGIVIATLVASPFATISESIFETFLLVIVVSFGVSIAWWLPASRDALTPSIWLQSGLMVLAWTLAVVGLSALLARIFREPTLGSAAATLLALTWLASPIWLGMHAAGVVRIHPLFAMNVSLIDLGLWTEQPFEYRYLFSLGQDVPYLLPTSIWPTLVLHGFIGLFSSAAGFSPLIFGLRKAGRPAD